MSVEFADALNREWTDISSEVYREYVFPNGSVMIENPLKLHVSDSGGHRVFSGTRDGTSYYIPPGWLAIEWRVKDGQPNFVK